MNLRTFPTHVNASNVAHNLRGASFVPTNARKMIGRYLLPEEVVHHHNSIPGDDRPENLFLYASNAEHKKDDYRFRQIDKNGRFLPKEI